MLFSVTFCSLLVHTSPHFRQRFYAAARGLESYWHAARRGLESNLYRLGAAEMVIQRILEHANVSTTATDYIKTAADDVRKAMTTLENCIAEAGHIQSDTNGTPESNSTVEPSTVQQKAK